MKILVHWPHGPHTGTPEVEHWHSPWKVTKKTIKTLMVWTLQPSIFRCFRGYVKLGCIHYEYTYQPPSRARKEIFAEKIGLSWFLSLMLVWEISYVTLGLYRRSFFSEKMVPQWFHEKSHHSTTTVQSPQKLTVGHHKKGRLKPPTKATRKNLLLCGSIVQWSPWAIKRAQTVVCWVCRGWTPTQLYVDYYKPLKGSHKTIRYNGK